eukprot:53957-Rhodomonas_salina.1
MSLSYCLVAVHLHSLKNCAELLFQVENQGMGSILYRPPNKSFVLLIEPCKRLYYSFLAYRERRESNNAAVRASTTAEPQPATKVMA